MDDGTVDRSGFVLHTNSFTLEEVQLLAKALKNKFDLNCSIHNRNGKVVRSHLLYIRADSWEKFKSLVEPHVIPHFTYKLTLRGSQKKD
jgi:hypothetical protein